MFTILMGLTLSSYAVEKETRQNLVDENRVLSSPFELHLTSSDSPLNNSTVSLNHQDSWLFFDNIKPSVAIASCISNVLINGEALKVGVNGRIAIYANGSVIMPFGFSFKPLTIFSEENFTGDSIQLAIEPTNINPGEFDNAVKSFKLKRGYMATFANNLDGTGYSRVFIADNEDLDFIVMPSELYGTVSFIRVFKYEWVSKKGKAGWNPNDINSTSYYDWNIGGNSSSDVEYVAIRQNGGWPSWSDIKGKPNVTHLLGFNEPDHTDQANMTFQEMINLWPEMMKSGHRIGSPAWANPWGGNGGTLFDFIDKCDELNYRVDFVALHCYWGGKSPQSWYNDLKYIHERTGRPLWITEWNNGANWTTEWWPDANKAYTDANAKKQLNDIKGILQVLDTASFIERYFIYDWVQGCRAMVLNGKLTLAGEYYAASKSEIAYNNKKEVIPHWKYRNPELSYRYFPLTHANRLSWTDSNGELSRKYIVEKKVNGGDFETIYSSDDFTKLFYLDPLDPNIGGTVTYRITLQTAKEEFLKSNVVSTYQTAGLNDIQVGSFSLDNTELNTSLFSKKYSTAPLVLLGISTFNNAVPLTQRVNTTTTTLFKFNLDPWNYIKNSILTKPDVLSAIALPSGSYDFGGLKAKAKAVSGVTRDWITVNFDEAFAKEPVVFCTIVSDGNSYPLTVGVRNVTTSGFEMCLKSEEATIATLLTSETINYFAIEPGLGVIDDKRITVGWNYGGSGISSTPVEIPYDSTYTEPAIYGGLLSAEDNFASTLRYSIIGESKFKIIKQREFSGGESAMQSDNFGWMIMDLAANQPDVGTGINEFNLKSSFRFYPNPAKEIVNFDFNNYTRIEILDMTGQKVMEANVLHSLNIASLPAGIYILKAKGIISGRLIKNK
ncbi:MAG: glycosyl hydrolase [Prolixibacteraceae bacterium]